ncbi:MAG: hypothetical protein ACXW2P_08035 [Thermoanaerobaculia bacterium]
MNLDSLGDSNDIIKKSFITWLSEFGRWSVHPMFTHEVDSVAADQFAKFLNATIVSAERLRAGSDRAVYFESCLSAPNLFLDPDTGVSLEAVTGARSSRYIFRDELLRIILARPHRLTLVLDLSFPRAARSRMEENVRRKLSAFSEEGAFGFAYLSQATVLCFAADPSLLLRAFEALKENSSLPPSRLIA